MVGIAVDARHSPSRWRWPQTVLDDPAGNLPHLHPFAHGGGADPLERGVLLPPELVHDHALGPADLALVVDHLLQAADLVLQSPQLLEPAEGDFDGGDDLTGLERLDQIGEGAGVPGLLDEVALA